MHITLILNRRMIILLLNVMNIKNKMIHVFVAKGKLMNIFAKCIKKFCLIFLGKK